MRSTILALDGKIFGDQINSYTLLLPNYEEFRKDINMLLRSFIDLKSFVSYQDIHFSPGREGGLNFSVGFVKQDELFRTSSCYFTWLFGSRRGRVWPEPRTSFRFSFFSFLITCV